MYTERARDRRRPAVPRAPACSSPCVHLMCQLMAVTVVAARPGGPTLLLLLLLLLLHTNLPAECQQRRPPPGPPPSMPFKELPPSDKWPLMKVFDNVLPDEVRCSPIQSLQGLQHLCGCDVISAVFCARIAQLLDELEKEGKSYYRHDH